MSRVIGITSVYPSSSETSFPSWRLPLLTPPLIDAANRTWAVTCADNVILHFTALLTVNTLFPCKGWIFVRGRWGVTSVCTVPLSWEINEVRVQKKGKKKTDSLRIVHICANQHCFVIAVFFFAPSDEIGRHKCLPHFMHLHWVFTHK